LDFQVFFHYNNKININILIMTNASSERITGPNWEVPENSSKVEFRFPNTATRELGLKTAHDVKEHLMGFTFSPLLDGHPGLRMSLTVNADFSYVVTVRARKGVALQDDCEPIMEEAFEGGAEMLAY